MTAPEPYLAAAIQTRAWSVESAQTVADARAGMMARIDRLRTDMMGTKAFLERFRGVPLRLAVLPEYLFSGFDTGRTPDFGQRAAFRMDGPEYAALGRIAADLDLFVAGNAYEIDPHFGAFHFQTSFVVGPCGGVVLRYRRMYSMYTPVPHDVWTEYCRRYSYAEIFPVANTAIGRLAAIASEEILFPEIARAHALQGAELFVHSSSEQGGITATGKHIARQARALENCAYVVSANTAGIEGAGIAGLSADGNSAVIDQFGRVLAESLGGENINAFATISIAGLRDFRQQPGMTNLLSRQRPDMFARTYAAPVYPADTLLQDGVLRAPARGEQKSTLRAVIAARHRAALI